MRKNGQANTPLVIFIVKSSTHEIHISRLIHTWYFFFKVRGAQTWPQPQNFIILLSSIGKSNKSRLIHSWFDLEKRFKLLKKSG